MTERPLIWHYPHYGNQGGEPSSIIRGSWKLIHYYEDGKEELYNLKNSLSETINLASENKDRVNEMNNKIFSMLDEMGARYPTKDPEWTANMVKQHLDKVVNELWPKLEEQRIEFLSPNFDPQNNWWGSDVKTID